MPAVDIHVVRARRDVEHHAVGLVVQVQAMHLFLGRRHLPHVQKNVHGNTVFRNIGKKGVVALQGMDFTFGVFGNVNVIRRARFSIHMKGFHAELGIAFSDEGQPGALVPHFQFLFVRDDGIGVINKNLHGHGMTPNGCCCSRSCYSCCCNYLICTGSDTIVSGSSGRPRSDRWESDSSGTRRSDSSCSARSCSFVRCP